MFLEYIPGNTFAHKADIRTKLITFVVVIVLTFLFSSPLPNAVLAVSALLLLFSIGQTLAGIGKLFAPLALIVFLIVLFAAVSPPSSVAQNSEGPLFHLWFNDGLPVTEAGLMYGLSLGLRIITMVALTSALVLCTPIEHFTAFLQQLRMPFAVIFIMTTALRFVPTMQHRSEQILEAQRARGAQTDGGGLIGKIKTYTTIMVPLFSTGIRMSEELAAAMLSRGYGISKYPTPLFILRLSWRDGVLLVATLLLLVAAIVARKNGIWSL